MHPISLYKHGNHVRSMQDFALYAAISITTHVHLVRKTLCKKISRVKQICMSAKLMKLKLIKHFAV